MSFTTDIIHELTALPTEKNCCRKALLCGLFFEGRRIDDANGVLATFRTESGARLASSLLKSRFSVQADVCRQVRAGRQYWQVRTACGAIAACLDLLDSDDPRMLWELLGFRCGNCRSEFLRGVFVATASVNDPQKGYHMEFALMSPTRADRLSELLESATEKPRRIQRAKKVGLYYKTNGAISDLIYYVGGTKSSFDMANTWIERDIRNNENRATNCVARNISRSVGASQKQIAAIEKLAEVGRLQSLPEELQMTAKLRIEHDAASLSELALLHEPPISKSGINQRLSRLLHEAEEWEEKQNRR